MMLLILSKKILDPIHIGSEIIWLSSLFTHTSHPFSELGVVHGPQFRFDFGGGALGLGLGFHWEYGRCPLDTIRF